MSPVNSAEKLNINTSSQDHTEEMVQFEDNLNGSGNFYSPKNIDLEELAA